MRPYRRPTAHIQRNSDTIQHFSLTDLLEETDLLAVCLEAGAVSLLSLRAGRPLLVEQQLFTPTELSMLLPLLDCYPYHCPYEVLLASFNTGCTSEKEVERARQFLHSKLDAREWDQVMRPLRNALARTRIKLRVFGIEATAITNIGYILASLSSIPPIRRDAPPTKSSRSSLQPL